MIFYELAQDSRGAATVLQLLVMLVLVGVSLRSACRDTRLLGVDVHSRWPLWTWRPLPRRQAPQNPLVGQATHQFSFRRRIMCFREKARAACGVAARGLEETPPRRVLGTVSPHIFSSRWRGQLLTSWWRAIHDQKWLIHQVVHWNLMKIDESQNSRFASS